MKSSKIIFNNGKLIVPEYPVIPFIEGDGTGRDLWASSVKVIDAAIEKAYKGKRKIHWKEVFAGEKSYSETNDWLPEETINAIKEFRVAIKGPLATPVDENIRSINIALQQKLDLYACMRPVRYYAGTPSPVKDPSSTDLVIFRENLEDSYTGMEWMSGTNEVSEVVDFLQNEMGVSKIRFPETTSIGIKPVSKEGSERLIRAALRYSIDNNRESLTLVHKGNVMKYTEGAFMDWGYDLAKNEFEAYELNGGARWGIKNPNTGKDIIIKDITANTFMQQILTKPKEYDVIATMNLNGDFIYDSLAAIVGGNCITPCAKINYETGHAIFEATHGSAPKYADQDKVNPGSLILSGALMLEYLGWNDASELITKGLEKAILTKRVTYDFHRHLEDSTLLKCSEFGKEIITHM